MFHIVRKKLVIGKKYIVLDSYLYKMVTLSLTNSSMPSVAIHPYKVLCSLHGGGVRWYTYRISQQPQV